MVDVADFGLALSKASAPAEFECTAGNEATLQERVKGEWGLSMMQNKVSGYTRAH